METSAIWNDRHVPKFDLVLIFSTIVLLLLFPLIPTAFLRIAHMKVYFMGMYSLDLLLVGILLLFLYFEKQRILAVSVEGLIFRWPLQTGRDIEQVSWKNVKRLHIINSWSPKNYRRWKRIQKDLSIHFTLKSIINAVSIVIETKEEDQVYFVDIVDVEGFVQVFNHLRSRSDVVANVPLLNFGIFDNQLL